MSDMEQFGRPENTQRLIVRTIIDCIMINEYKKLTTLLEVLIRSLPSGEAYYNELESIKAKTSIEFNRFEMFYKMSLSSSPKRCVNFSDIGKVPMPIIRVLFEEEAIKPITALTVKVLSVISIDDSLFLRKLIETQSKGAEFVKKQSVKMDLTV